MDNNVLFSERQSFRQPWVYLMIVIINGPLFFGVITQVFLGQPFGTKPLPDIGLVIITVMTLLVSSVILYFRLDTIIKVDGIYVRFYPIHLTFIYYPWDMLNQLFVRQYNPIREYGGWGLRGLGKNQALNVSGNNGVQLVARNGSKMLIGTKKPSEIATILKQLGHEKA